MAFPQDRPRRLRRTEGLRRLVRETVLRADDLILPLFAIGGRDVANPIEPMPGQYQLSVDRLLPVVRDAWAAGIPAVILFGLPEGKDALGSGAYAPDGIVQRAVTAVKEAVPDMTVITDVCLCEYTDHGHCGVVSDGDVENDATLDLLARTAVSHAAAGADVVAPSDMMDGRVGAIRRALDENGHARVPIMAYAAKYCSAFYGPFRLAADSAPQFGDRRTYQMDPANGREAVRETLLDVAEGADIVMVKPALAYLDVICRVRRAVDRPVAAYSVSGEYSMIKAAARLDWLDETRVMMEALTAVKRAGADMILTYFAVDAARALQG